MKNNNFSKIEINYGKRTANISSSNAKEYKIYTPEMIQKYKDCFRRILKFTNDKTKTKSIMYNRVSKWYEREKNINISMEKIYINSKLGSYTSGGCGIGASFFAGLIASGLFSYMEDHIKKLGPISFSIYSILILCFGFKVLSIEDKKVEMYNIFLEALNNLEYDNNENQG